MVCQRWWVTKWCVKNGSRKKVDVTKRHTCHAKRRYRCLQARRLPRETKVDVTKRLAWHAKWKSMSPSATPATQSGSPWSPSATPAKQSDCPCRQVPRLPRKQRRRPRRQLGIKRATRASPVPQVPRLPRKVEVHGHQVATPATQSDCHVSPSTTPATQTAGGVHGVNWEPSAPPEPAQCQNKCHACHAEVHVHVSKRLICHAECTYMSPSTTPATQTAAASTPSTGNQPRHQSQPSAISATPATQNARTCRQVPHLPRRMHARVAKYHACHANIVGVHGVNWEPSAPPEPAQCHKCHACHAECTYKLPSAAPPSCRMQAQVAKYHACHANSCVASTASFGEDKLCHQSKPSAMSDKLCRGQVVCGQVVCGQVVWERFGEDKVVCEQVV